MKNWILIIALLALWPGYVYGQINQDVVNSDVPGGGGGGGGGGLSESDIDTLTKLNNIISPDVLGTSSSQSITNKLIDCNGNTCKPLRGEDCTAFDAATGGQYCVDTDDLVIYFCSVGIEDPCDDPEEWVAISSASTMAGLDDVSLTDPQDGDMLSYDSGDWINIVPPFLKNTGTLDDGEFCVYLSSSSHLNCNVPLGSLANLNSLLGGINIVDTGTRTDGRLCTWDNAGDEIDCNTVDDDVPEAGDYTNLTGGTGITNNPTGIINVDSSEAGFLTAGALTCGAGTAGKAQIHTTPLQYCDNTATPVQRYAAYGDSSGNALTGDSAAGFFATGELEDARVVDTITASNYCLLSGCALTGASSITSNFTLGATALLQWGSSGVSSSDVFFARDAAGVLKVYGAEGGNSSLGIYADEGDDNADKWKLTAHTDGHFGIYQNTSEVLSLSSSGVIGIATIPGSLVTNTPAGDIAADDVQEAINELDTEKQAAGTYATLSFTTINAPSGTDPVADSVTDTLNLTASGGLSITGDSSTDTLAFGLTLTDSEIPNDITINTAATAGALGANGTNCNSGEAARGVDASGNAEGCFAPSIAADAVTFSDPDSNFAATNVEDAIEEMGEVNGSGPNASDAKVDWTQLGNVPAFRKTLVQLKPNGASLPASSFANPNSRNSIPTLRFNGNVSAFWCFTLPNTYGGNGVTVEFWVVSTETSNDTDWDVAWARMEAEDLDTSNPYASAISADNNNNSGTSGIPTKVSAAFANNQMDSCAAGEFCCVKITRDDAADTGGANTIDYAMGAIKETP